MSPRADDPAAPPVRRRRPADRRAQIVDAARTLIAHQGLAATSAREIAAASGVSTGTVSYHFPQVRQILHEALRAEAAQFTEPVMAHARAASTGRESLGRLLDAMLRGDERTMRHWALWIDYWAASAHDPVLAEWQRSLYDWWTDQTALILQQGRLDGTLRGVPGTAAEITEAATELVAVMDGVTVQFGSAAATSGTQLARRTVVRYVNRHLQPSEPYPEDDEADGLGGAAEA